MATAAATADRVPPLVMTDGGPGGAVLRRLNVVPLGEGARRVALILAAVTWVPLLVLTVIEGMAVGGVPIPFLYDLAAHVRFLVAVPVLVLAEIPIGLRLRQTGEHFLDTGLIAPEDRARFADIITDTVRFRDSRVAELIVLGAAYVAAYGALTGRLQSGSTWYEPTPGGLTAAGYWYTLVAIPIFQFLIFRWLYRMLVWARFLRRVRALDLHLTPTHPDGAAGLGFLGKSCVPFGIILFATSAVVASSIATRVLFDGARLDAFQLSYAALLLISLAVFTGPLLVFLPLLARVKHHGLLEYGTLASRYTQQFDRKWVQGDGGADEPLLGTADVQSLADLGNSYELVKKMRLLPIELADFLAMAIPGVIPAIPLAATVMPVGDILKGLLHLLA